MEKHALHMQCVFYFLCIFCQVYLSLRWTSWKYARDVRRKVGRCLCKVPLLFSDFNQNWLSPLTVENLQYQVSLEQIQRTAGQGDELIWYGEVRHFCKYELRRRLKAVVGVASDILRQQERNGYRASKPTVWTFHMPTCDHHDTASPTMICDDDNLLHVVHHMEALSPSVGSICQVACVLPANTHTHTHTTSPTHSLLLSQVKIHRPVRCEGPYICILKHETHICGSVRNLLDTNSSTIVKFTPKRFEQPVIHSLIQIWSTFEGETRGRKTQTTDLCSQRNVSTVQHYFLLQSNEILS
jgi:hypothetical protein